MNINKKHIIFFIFFAGLLLFSGSFFEQTAYASQQDSSITYIRSLYPKENYANVKTYYFYEGDDVSDLPRSIAAFSFGGCIETPFVLSREKCVTMYADWYLKDSTPINTSLNNVHFSLDSASSGTYELIGYLIPPEGYAFAEELTVPEAHVFIHILEYQEQKEITRLFPDFSALTMTEATKSGDTSLQEHLLYLAEHEWIGVTDTEEYVPLILEWDFSQVDFYTPGTYKALLTFSIPDDLTDSYVLPEELSHYAKTIIVADDTFKIFFYRTEPAFLTIKYTKEPESNLELTCYYLSSDRELSEEELSSSVFARCDDIVLPDTTRLRIYRDRLQKDIHYYFQIEYLGERSNILHIPYTDSFLSENSSSNGHTGNRDGGDTVEPDHPSVTQPAVPDSPNPDAPSVTQSTVPDLLEIHENIYNKDIIKKEEDPKTQELSDGKNSEIIISSSNSVLQTDSYDGSFASSSPIDDTGMADRSDTISAANNLQKDGIDETAESQETSAFETLTETSATLSAGRITLMKREYKNSLPFTLDGITAYIPADLLELKDSDTVTVEIKRTGKNTFSFRLLINGNSINFTNPVTIYFPSNGITYTKVYFENTLTESTITESDNFAVFSIFSNGNYQLTSNETQDNDKHLSPQTTRTIWISAPFFFFLIILVITLIKKKGQTHL